ncbi:hypothetical protein Pmani_029808 [Petrolisthes manimaculis]|uniref:RING-type E3 ubiquitin transferase n=1 Tax=Petrolisthes manimaculis TaxID=1843537 RepID=A0AAE1NWY1_9EUCA|nr:hypothetical protein Pmani_029808 [Petrolisthes manimaculis]
MEVEVSLPWPTNIPQLKRLDELLRCGICYEFMTTSMVTLCSHNYCSLCIRKYLSYKPQCPACYRETTDQHLRNNRLIDEIITLFPSLRDKVARLNQCVKGNSIAGYFEAIGSEKDGEKVGENNTSQPKPTTVPPPSPQPSRASPFKPQSERILVETPKRSVIHGGKNKLSRTLSRTGKTDGPSTSPTLFSSPSQLGKLKSPSSSVVASQSPSSRLTHSTTLSGSVSGYFSIRNNSPHRAGESSSSSSSGGGGGGGGGGGEGGTNVEDGERVACPVCSVEVPQRNINIHLDACLKSVNEEEIVVIEKQGPKKRALPKLVYSLLNDKQLKQKLREAGLGTQGDRSTLVTRHKRYTTLYNAECDVAEPRSPSELVRQVERDERDVNRASTSNQSVFSYDRKTAPEVIEKEQKAYLKKNNDHFSKLIADIKKRKAEKNTKQEDTKVDEDVTEDKNKGRVTKGRRNIKKTTTEELNDDAWSKKKETIRGGRNINIIIEEEREVLMKRKTKGKSINQVIEEDSEDDMDSGVSNERAGTSGSSCYKQTVPKSRDQRTANHQEMNAQRRPQNRTVASFSKQTGRFASEKKESLEETETCPVKLLKLSLIHQKIGDKRSRDEANNNNNDKKKMGDTNSGQDRSIASDCNFVKVMKLSHKKIMHNPEQIKTIESSAGSTRQSNTTNRSSEVQSVNHCTDTLVLAAPHTDDKLFGEVGVDPSPDLFSSSPARSETSEDSFSLLADTEPLSPTCLPAGFGKGDVDSDGEEVFPARQPDLSHSVNQDEGEDKCPPSSIKPLPGSIIHCNLENTEILTPSLEDIDSDHELEGHRNELGIKSLPKTLNGPDILQSQTEAEECSKSSDHLGSQVLGNNYKTVKLKDFSELANTCSTGDADGQSSTVAHVNSLKGGKEHCNMISESQISLVIDSQLVPSPPIGSRRRKNETEKPCPVPLLFSEPVASKAMSATPVPEKSSSSKTNTNQSKSTKGKPRLSVASINDLGADTQLVIGDTPFDPDYTPSQDMDAELDPLPSVPTTRRSNRKRKRKGCPEEETLSTTRGRRKKK